LTAISAAVIIVRMMANLNFKQIIMLLAVVLMVAGCSSDNGENVTVVVVTGVSPEPLTVGQQVTTIPPTVTLPPPTSTPAPGMTPEMALRIGDSYFLNGYYENAVTTYQTILAEQNAPAEMRANAAFNMGRAALRAGLFREAVESINILINEFPQDFRAAQGYFLRGDAYLGLSQWQNAIDDFQQYLALRPGLIDSYAYERIGDAQLNLGQLDAALDSYAQATANARSTVPGLALREQIARRYLASGRNSEAVAQYDAILQVAENVPYRAQIEYAAAEALFNAGDVEPGLRRYRQVFQNYPEQPQAYQAMNVLIENGVTVDQYQRGLVNTFAEDYTAAVEAFNTYTTQVPLAGIPADLNLYLGRSYRALGNFEAALVAFQTVIERYSQDPAFGDALLETGRTPFLEGDLDTAIQRYLEVGTTYGYLPDIAAEALWRAGYLYDTRAELAASQEVFLRLATDFPNTSWAQDGLFIAAESALAAGDTATAESLYARLAATAAGENRAEAQLMVGRLALERGDQTAATQAFTAAMQAAPDTYPSTRAQDLLAGRAPFTPPDEFVFRFDALAEVTEAENWLRATFGVNQAGPLWPLPPAIENDPRMIRGQELWAVGAFDAATTEFFELLWAYGDDGLASYQIAVALRIIGAFYPSIFAAANVIIAADVPTVEAPGYIARMRYPIYYRDVVIEAAAEYDFDPLILFSLIRHESLFNTFADGGAGENGLTQVIPSTSQYIAGQIDWEDYQHSDLYRPHAGAAFGAYFLDEQLERFDGNVYAALAGYNAGPSRAIRWLEAAGEDPDRFMAAIDISSTQLYVQLIYKNYNIYRALYSAGA
jgi:soluble lytic murein transglycosylase